MGVGVTSPGGVRLGPTADPSGALTLSSPDAVTLAFSHSTTPGATYQVFLYDAATGALLASTPSTGSGTFTVPAGTYSAALLQTGFGLGPLATQVVSGPAPPAPDAWWPLSESGNVPRVASLGGLNAVPQGTVGSTTGYRYANAADFPSGTTSDYLKVSGLPVDPSNAAATVMCRVLARTRGDLANTTLFAFGDDPSTGKCLSFFVDSSGHVFPNRPGVANYTSPGNIPFNKWIHLAIVVVAGNPNTYSLYVNGELVGTSTGGTLAQISTAVFGIGGSVNDANALADFKGQMNDFEVDAAARTQAEIRNRAFNPSPPPPGVAVLAPTTGLRECQNPPVFANRTNVIILPAANAETGSASDPFTTDWPDGRLVRSYAGPKADTYTVAPAADMVANTTGAVQTTVPVTLPNTAGSLWLSDGERVGRFDVLAAETGSAWTQADADALKAHCAATVTACSHGTGDAAFLHGWVSAGLNFDGIGMFEWDSAQALKVAGELGDPHRTNAKGWARSKTAWIVAPSDSRGRDGAIPLVIYTNNNTPPQGFTSGDSGPQQPLNAWGIHELVTSEASPDLTFVADVYPWLKASHNYHELVDNDGSNLYSISGGVSGADPNTVISQKRADVDGTCNDALWMDLEAYTPDGTGVTKRTTFCDPERTALLALSYDRLSALATLNGSSSDATTFAAKAAAVRAAVSSLMWDEAQLRFQWIERAALARTAGSVAAASAGATSITLTATGTRWLPAGCKLLLPGGVVAQPAATVELINGVPTTVTLCNPLSGPVSSGSATYRPFAEVCNAGMQSAPLFAGCATQAQAAAVRDRLMTILDGITPQSWECWFGNTLRANRHVRAPWVQWRPFENAGNVTHNATDTQIAAGTTGFRIGYRRVDSTNIKFGVWVTTDANNGYMWHHPAWERVSASAPLTVTVEWVKAGTTAPTVTIKDWQLNTVLTRTLSVPAGSDGSAVTATLTVTAGHLPGVVEIAAPSDGALRVRRVKITTVPKGWMYRSPGGGLSSTPRLSRVHLSKPLSRLRGANSIGYHDLDYWQGDGWPPHNFWAAVGLNAYGLPEGKILAAEFARRTLTEADAWAAYLGSEQGVFERMSACGTATGSSKYVWGCLAWAAGRDLGVIPA